MILKNFWPNQAVLLSALLLASPLLSAQSSSVIAVQSPANTSLKKGEVAEVKLRLEVKPGYHVNSNKPADEYLIPLKLSFDTTPLESVSVHFPPPKMEKYPFSDKPLSVYSGSFEIVAKVKSKPDARSGMNFANAKLRYQACTENACLPPKTIDVRIPFELF